MDNKYGIVLDGEIAIGEFVFSTTENDHGQRQLIKLTLNSGYVDIVNGQSKNVRCLLVEKISKKDVNDPNANKIVNPLCIKIIEDFGLGIIEGRCMIDNKTARYQSAVFIRNPPKLNNKLN